MSLFIFSAWAFIGLIFMAREINRAGFNIRSSLSEAIARRVVGVYAPVAFGLGYLALRLPTGWKLFVGWYIFTWLAITFVMAHRAYKRQRLSYDIVHNMMLFNLLFGIWFVPVVINEYGKDNRRVEQHDQVA